MKLHSIIKTYLKIRYILPCILAMSFMARALGQNAVGSYIVSRTVLTADSSKILTQQVFDNGLGDVIQEVQSWSDGNLKDIVVHHEYDKFRRQTRSWLPVISDKNGGFVSGDMIANMAQSQYSDNAPFTLTQYDEFLPSQPSAQYKAGEQWQSNDKKVSVTYGKYVGCAMYSDEEGRLYVTDNTAKLISTRTTDEDGQWSAEYTDLNGRVIISETSQGKTFYMYNPLGNLTFVIPPILSDYLISYYGYDSEFIPDTDEMICKYAYVYRYDRQGHCTYKKLPGCEPIYYVYDRTGTCILTQDGEQRKSGVWAYCIPDIFGRPCISGICHNSISYTSEPLHQYHVCARYDGTSNSTGGYEVLGLMLDSQTMYAATYYDNYDFIGQHGVPSSLDSTATADFPIATVGKGLQTGSAEAIIKNGSVTGYKYSAMYYDSRYNVAQVKATNHFGGVETTCTAYSYTGKPKSVKIQHSSNRTGTLTENITLAYDEADRLETQTLSVSNGVPPLTLAFGYEYDALGRLVTTTRPLTGTINRNVSYSYDLHGWQKGITTTSFSEELFYADGPGSHSYNGNISSMKWKNDGYYWKRGYKFTYDDAGRMTQANYGEGDAISSTNKFGESVQYDALGNITNIVRRGKLSSSNYGIMDNLTLSYDGNQLVGVSEAATDYDVAGSFEYKRLKGSQYIYNSNGALVADKSRGIAYISYDLYGYPQTIYFTNGNMTRYTYSGLGEKLCVEHFVASPNVTWTFGVMPDISQSHSMFAGQTDYLLGGSLIVQDGMTKRVLFDGGYFDASAVSPTTYGFTPFYYNKDHLGNNREVINASGTVRQVTNYYPFGAPYADPAAVMGSTIQQYKYNGKELDTTHGLNTYDYGARQQDPILGRWDRIDPLCEKYYNVSPYVYCANNPIRFIDPNGRDIKFVEGTSTTFIEKYSMVRKYLIEKGCGQLIELFENDKNLTLLIGERADGKSSGFTSNRNCIFVDLDKGITSTDSNGNRHFLSPAVVLIHEFDHAWAFNYDKDGYDERTQKKDPLYGDMEEKRVINGKETDAARNLGEINEDEMSRDSHGAVPFTAVSPISNEPINKN